MHNNSDMHGQYTLVWSFRNKIDILKRSIITANGTTPDCVDFLLIDGESDMNSLYQLRSFCNSITNRRVKICESFYRTSLSEAWNLGIMMSNSDKVIISSSDVEFLSPLWFIYLNEYMSHYDYTLLENHAVFCLSKSIVPIVGWFDERFGIGPHFDTDYYIRLSEKGITPGSICNNGLYNHGHDNPAEESIRKSHNFEDRLPMFAPENEQYFKSKWKSNWSGWDFGGHPPNHIDMCHREIIEIDPHPMYTKKISSLLGK